MTCSRYAVAAVRHYALLILTIQLKPNLSVSQPTSARPGLLGQRQRETDRLGQDRFVLGSAPSSRLTIGSGTYAPRGSSRRARGTRNAGSRRAARVCVA